MSIQRFFVAIMLILCLDRECPCEEPWTTFRGNILRTGNTDGKSGPTSPKVLWVYRASDHLIGSPVPVGENLLFTGVGAFNRPIIFALPQQSAKTIEPVWSKSSPFFKLPIVSSPAVIDGKIILGDGMHQTDGGKIYCLPASGGLPLWQYDVPGSLVHLEGSPSIMKNRVTLGGGAAGVICLEWDNVTIGEKKVTLKELEKLHQSQWDSLQAKYAAEKKKDPDFALPPSEDQLTPAKPKLLWQTGKDKWHVDAPVVVDEEAVYLSSAYLDKEKVGERAVFALNGLTGEILWKTPLKFNPWGGVTISGDTLFVSTSSIGYDYKSLKGAKGEIYALEKKTGKIKWRKDIPGGVLASVAISNDLAVFTATDGKLRALTIQDGERRILYDAKAPFFAPPAVSNSIAFVADLNGVIHSVDLKSGNPVWKLDLKEEPIKAPGLVYGGIIIHNGKLFLGTSNLDGPFAQKGTIALCIGQK